MINYFKAMRIPKDKLLTKDECMIVLRARGYRKTGDYSFGSYSGEASYNIDILDEYISVKMCNGEFSDKEYMRMPVNKKTLVQFVRKSMW